VEGILAVLLARHEKMTAAPGETLSQHEQEFTDKFGVVLRDSLLWCRRFQATHKHQDLTSAWDGFVCSCVNFFYCFLII
jgi:hypothetical protein